MCGILVRVFVKEVRNKWQGNQRNRMRPRATKASILPLSQYLLDPQTQGQQARLLATLALGDLFQNESLARSADAVSVKIEDLFYQLKV
ncbi:hypothetical protein LIER_36408 [Lithospermum erythrorhizon]|uniref:Uncharacterized protein n=1 Tax=Lithospermum erythrorhizon TaxID=34254 RepID=A0AAV3P7D4_LITER